MSTSSNNERTDNGSEPYVADNPSHSRLAIKHGAHFLVTNDEGMMPGNSSAGYGLYYSDTRFLSRWQLYLNDAPLRLLRSSVAEGFAGKFVYGNPNLPGIPEQQVLVEQDVVIIDGRMRVRLTITNFSLDKAQLRLSLRFGADFYDMFEVRGAKRPKRGVTSEPVIASRNRGLWYSYRGLDGIEMSTSLRFHTPRPNFLSAGEAKFAFNAAPGRANSQVIEISVKPHLGSDKRTQRAKPSFDDALAKARSMYESWRAGGATITTDNDRFNQLLERSYRDIYMLRQPSPRGDCLAAGIPWFTVAFGRDQCITGMQTVALMPQLARDIVSMLAAYQATMDDEFTAQQVGKIMHELRLGEMARLKEIAFCPYYGTVDATQLWLMLLCRYVEWTGDLRFARSMWKHVGPALAYLDKASRSGYITYGGKPGAALTNQGWKDSHDSIMYSDGKQARAPIALSEAQGYLYAAWSGLAAVASALGYSRQSRTLARKAAGLKARFRKDFWMPQHNFVALALDGDGRQCDVVSSNPGHILSTGILEPDQAHAVAARLVADDMFCGWGIRTLSAQEKAYNPMSYHNGSVWPHDNAEAVYGFGRISEMTKAHKVLRGMFEVAKREPSLRLPELFSGFNKSEFSEHVSYPVSCSPQAWAAGSIFHMLVACLGLHPDGSNSTLRIVNPSIPAWLGTVRLTNLRVGNSSVDIEFASTVDGGTTCRVLSKQGDMRVAIEG